MGKTLFAAAAQFFEGQKFAALLMVLGVASAGLGGIGAWPYPPLPIGTGGQITLIVVGAIVFFVGLILYFIARPGPFDPKKYNVRITNYENGSQVRPDDSKINFSGTFIEKPPADYRVMILELEGQDRFRPRKFAVIDEGHKSWHAEGVWVGNQSGVQRTVAAALIGPSSRILVKYFDKVGEVYRYSNRPSIEELPPDVYICHQIRVTTR